MGGYPGLGTKLCAPEGQTSKVQTIWASIKKAPAYPAWSRLCQPSQTSCATQRLWMVDWNRQQQIHSPVDSTSIPEFLRTLLGAGLEALILKNLCDCGLHGCLILLEFLFHIFQLTDGSGDLQAYAQVRSLLSVHWLICKARTDHHWSAHAEGFHEAVLTSMGQEEIHPGLQQIHLRHHWQTEGVLWQLEMVQGISLWTQGNQQQWGISLI
mmetsp:Transcript_87536/g.107296  ORF Transcript_87536/g.107296 Transcript_87536/m.107296 type:complete len:211 (+) Transcript_87536:171-803(+)